MQDAVALSTLALEGADTELLKLANQLTKERTGEPLKKEAAELLIASLNITGWLCRAVVRLERLVDLSPAADLTKAIEVPEAELQAAALKVLAMVGKSLAKEIGEK